MYVIKQHGCSGVLRAILAASIVSILGCTSGPKSPEPLPDNPPRDFTIDLAVFAPATGAALPPDLQPGVYVLEPGGSVRIRMGPTAIDGGQPPFRGRMSPGEIEQTWRLVLDSGLLNPDNPNRVSASSLVGARFERSVAAMVITAGGKRRWFRISLGVPTPDAATVRSLIDRLAEYAPAP